MKHRMTEQQQRAVETVAGDLAISAGAGSGKTTVLAHRFAHALRPDANAPWAPAEIDRILTITFTNKAAGEIAERVRRVVNTELSVEEGRRVGEAWISTIHTFCGRLVRRHLLESGVEPRFTQLDQVEASLLKDDAFELAASALYGTDPGVTRLLDAGSVQTLRASVVAVHDNVRAMGLDPGQVRVPVGSADRLEALKAEVHACAHRLKDELAECTQSESIVRKRKRLDDWCGELSSCALGEAEACGALVSLLEGYDVSHLSGAALLANAELKQAIGRAASAARASIRSDEVLGMEALVRSFAAEYRKLKSQRAALDFDDLQELAVRLLEGRPEIAARYREHFRMLMVDEFQDTNDLQVRVVDPLRSDNLCIVGDEQQSIYGFRYADVQIFERMRMQIANREQLTDNFRSHPEILDFVNVAFSMPHLFGPEFLKLRAGKADGWSLPVAEGSPRVECVLVDAQRDEKSTALATEARAVAARIAALVSGGAKGRDVAVLLRNATHAAVFAAELERVGIQVLVSAGIDLFDAPEVKELKSALRAVAVLGDDEALAATLASRLVRLSDDGLYALRLAAGRDALWDALGAAALGMGGSANLSDEDLVAVRLAHRVLGEMNSRHSEMSLHELVHRVCEEFDYDLTLFSLGAPGLRAWGNVQTIARYAEQFEAVEPGDLAAFVDHLNDREAGSKDKAAPVEAGDDVVRVMTVHAAKGLEFKTVFVADLGAAKSHAAGSVLVAKDADEGGVAVVGVKLPNVDGEQAATPVHMHLETEHQHRELAEQKRCLYVACTRAEELLVLSGTTRVGDDASQGKAVIDWIREAIGDPKQTATVPFGTSKVGVTVLQPEEAPAALPEAHLGTDGPLVVDSGPRTVPVRPHRRPRHVSYSSMHRHEACPLSYHVTAEMPIGRFKEPGARAASEFGSALHAVMQTLGPEGPDPRSLEAAARRFRLDEVDARRLEAGVSAFLDSPLAQRLRSAERVASEEPIWVSVGETVLAGSVDVLAWNGTEALIVDYKTGREPAGAGGGRRAAYELQAKCYALAAFEAGATAVEAIFCFVEHGPVESSFVFHSEQAGAIRDEIDRRIDAMADDTRTHLAHFDPEACVRCPALGGVCPVEGPKGR